MNPFNSASLRTTQNSRLHEIALYKGKNLLLAHLSLATPDFISLIVWYPSGHLHPFIPDRYRQVLLPRLHSLCTLWDFRPCFPSDKCRGLIRMSYSR
ncbi:hypothetical protein NPIL_109081 [Nephila pilipes]|uniref:Uncharacterized protein n=1 Tax=Nephila pilipes TaxID=299642 RepID=A0A8X6MQ55_NEPPI|nr:hypothetical protein NPIL_109081 [Nephila pilipes]